MKVNVTQKHIDDGVPSHKHCPIALAIRETHLPVDCGVDVKASCVEFITLDGEWVSSAEARYRLPQKAQRFVSDFDKSKRVYPFKFEMGEIVDGV